MASNEKFVIEVAYAAESEQKIVTLEVEQGTTIERAIERSGILEIFPEIDLFTQKVGVFSKARSLNDLVKSGDRIEIYRPLTIDPKEARRRRVKKK
jgi:uncharacterized protein